MAPRSPLSTVPNTPLLNGHPLDAISDTIEQTRLPNGGCSFTILSSVGGSAPRCGCRRYYDKPSVDAVGRPLFGKSGYCMCDHHACYHEHEPEERQTTRAASDVQDVPARSPTPKPSDNETIRRSGQLQVVGEESLSRRPPRESPLPDTLQWNHYIHSGPPESLPAIPSQCLLPSENGSRTSSQARYHRPFGGLGLNTLGHIPNPSIGAPISQKKPQPLAENTRAMQVYRDANGNEGLQSITELATPSVQTSQLGAEFDQNVSKVQEALEKLAERKPEIVSFQAIKEGASQLLVKQSYSNPGMDSATIANDSDDHLIPRLRSILARIASFPTTTENHERRLDCLENTSFTNPVVEDLQEGHSLMDIRVCELETRLGYLEKIQMAQSDVSSVNSRHNLEGSMDSRISTTSSAITAAAIDKVDNSRIESLEAQVAELQACAPPSHSRPWQLEVVFLPFGSQLSGVWSSYHTSTQLSRANSGAEDSWTQTQNHSLAAAQATLAAQEHTSAWERSTADISSDENASWLIAKACASGSRIDERLRSRGLVKTLEVKGPDAKDVQAAIMSAFGDTPALLVEDPYTQHDEDEANTIPSTLANYLGLQASWIPLRKLHKNSSLRFLSTSEMCTPALWTVQFLSSSVAMRTSGLRRLYVTQRDSYIQHHGDVADWTWQKLRQLPRVYPDNSASDHTPEADAHEPCWEFDERLDPAPVSVHASFESQVSSLSIRSLQFEEEPLSPSDHFSSAAGSLNATTPKPFVPPPTRMLSPLIERNPFRPIHIRTSSLPSLVPIKSPAQASKRRITSFEQEAQSSPIHATASASNLAGKRRRISRSPSRPRDTPRWSDVAPSPYAFQEEINDKRPSTPFAYATPHSNAPYVDTRRTSGEDIEIWQDGDDGDDAGSATNAMTNDNDGSEGWDQNALSDFEPGTSDQQSTNAEDELAHQPDEEWQGLDNEIGCEPLGLGLVSKTRVGPLTPHIDDEQDDAQSDASSQPSEYPSTQQGLYSVPRKPGFTIHVDDELDELH